MNTKKERKKNACTPALPIDEIDDRWQSLSINRLILIIDEQLMKKIFVTLSIGIGCYQLASIVIDYHNAVFLSIVFPLSWPLLPFRVLLIHHGSSYHARVSRLIKS